MKAAVHTRYGPPEVVQVTEIDKPTIKADELLIKVHATTGHFTVERGESLMQGLVALR
jgi:NADPH:quinone reductase-like Zn-dependent oxidoreductase